MCQSVAQGGRRCPAHRYDTRNVIDAVREREPQGYGQSLYHAAFLDLRVQNRGVVLRDSGVTLAQVGAENAGIGRNRPVDSDPADHATLSSHSALLLDGVVDQYEDQVILSAVNAGDEEVSREIFSYVYDHIENYDEPTAEQIANATSSLDWGVGAGRINRDPKAIKTLALFQSGALHQLDPDTPPVSENVVRITDLQNVMSSGSPVAAVAFSPESVNQNSRLEMILRDDLDTRLAYQNVSEEQFEAIERGGPGAAAAVEQIRLDPNCRYESPEAMERASVGEDRSGRGDRCMNCGQYVGATPHACPALQLQPNLYRLASAAVPVEPEHEVIVEEAVTPVTPETPAHTTIATSLAEPVVPQNSEEMVYPTTETLLANMHYEEVEIPNSNGSSIRAKRVKSLYSRERDAFIEAGVLLPDTDENAVVLYQYQRDHEESRPTDSYRVLEIVPRAAARGLVVSGSRVFMRPQGRLLETGRTWQDEYGAIPEEGVTNVTQNATASTMLSPASSTSTFFSAGIPHTWRGEAEPEPLTLVEQTGRGTRDKWRFGNARETRRGLEAGETVVVPFSHEYGGGWSSTRQAFVDAQGWEVNPPRRYHTDGITTSGKVALRKNANGVVEVVGVESLHCSSCSNANCTHLGYSVRQSAYLGQKIIAPPVAGGTTSRGGRRLPNPETGLPVSLESHCQVTRNEDGQRTIRFHRIASRRVFNNAAGARLAVPSETLTEPEIYGTYAIAPNPTHLTRAVRNLEAGESVEVPLEVSFTPSEYYRSTLITATVNGHRYLVNGTITYGRDDEGNPVVTGRTLRCQCEVYQRNYSCTHTRRVEAGEMGLLASIATQEGIAQVNRENNTGEDISNIATRLAVQEREARLGREISLEEAQVLVDAESALSRSEQYDLRDAHEREFAANRAREARRAELEALAGYTEQREKMKERYANFQGTRYSEDYAAFESEVDAVKAKIAAGEDPHTFVPGSVLGGIGDDNEHARKFGVEIEVVFPNGSTSAQKAAVAQALRNEGLSDSGSVGSYHSGSRSGWAKWTAENDGTVDLEVVSPLMKDTPEDWTQLQKVCDIIKANGGQADIRTGSHVHISTGDYGSSVASHAALLDEFSRYSDVLYRLGSNPETKTHRGRTWCAPNVVYSGTEVDGANAGRGRRAVSSYLQSYHSAAVNLEASGDGAKSHAEIRIWDGSVSPAHIQMQVMMTAAMTEVAAQRINNSEDDKFTFSPESEHMPLGSSRGRRFSGPEEESAKFREMIDRYFPDEERRKQLIALWVTNSKWQS